ncbi:MAG: HD domain-containing phosphohydrolase [Thermodesulfobacteriota bacterium]|jgi:putative two-component system response regulator
METASQILVVEDDPMTNRLLATILTRLGYNVETAFDGINGLEKVETSPPDLILLDLNLPRMDGYEVARRLKQADKTKIIPIVVISSFAEVENRVAALEAGADDFLSKPIDQVELRARVQSLLKVKMFNDYMISHQKILEAEVDRRTQQLRQAFEELKSASEKIKQASLDTTFRLAQAVESKDEETGGHIKRIGYYSTAVARVMVLPPQDIEGILYAAPMHDIGKIGIPDRILLKSGSLNDEEWKIMKMHTVIGGRILSNSDSDVIQMAEQIALAHHEKWDGSGYPNGLKGSNIPLWGRISAIVDVFDALTTDRPYKKAFPIDQSMEILKKGKGTHFDPEVSDAFFSIHEEILSIRREYEDPVSEKNRVAGLD